MKRLLIILLLHYLFIKNYVALVNLADQNGGELPKRVNYILDEFGNFTSQYQAFSNMLTVAGGRKIRFNMFLQSFAQLEDKIRKRNSRKHKR